MGDAALGIRRHSLNRVLFDKGAGHTVLSQAITANGHPHHGGLGILNQADISYYAYRVFGALVPWVPPRVGYRVFEWLGDLAYLRSEASRESVMDNLRHVLGDQANPERLSAICRSVFRNQARNYYDLFRLPALTAEHVKSIATLRGLEHLEEALRRGKGAIAFSAHFGNLEIVGHLFGIHGYGMVAPAEHLEPDKLFRYVVSLRARHGLRPLPADGFMRPLFRTLRRNGIVGLAGDRNLTGTGTWTEFFGAPALLPDGHVQLALRTGACLVPAFGFRHSDNTLSGVVEPALDLKRTGDFQSDLRSGMAQVVEVLERYIGQYPEQWVMFQPLWAPQPGLRSS